MRPNIVLIVADDMGYGDLSSVNGGLSSTPALDQLQAEGIRLSQHYSASPVCAPARAALLTGRYPQRTGVIDTLEARGTDRLSLSEITIADELSRAGYRTGLVGKWHTGAIGAEYGPLARGFDEFIGFRGGWQDYWDWSLEYGSARRSSDGRYLTDVLTDEAIGFLRRNAADRTTPFFLHVAYNAPHYPFQAPSEIIARHRRPGRTEGVAIVYAMLEVMDAGIGRIRETLRDLGVDEQTLILFTSDNGPDLGGEGEGSTARFNAGLSGQKQYVDEGGIRVPLLASWPEGLPSDTTIDAVTHFTDWYPTLLDAAGIRPHEPGRLDGESILPVLRGESMSDRTRFWQWTRYAPTESSNAAVRQGPYKLVRPADPHRLAHDAEDEIIDIDIKAHPEKYPTPIDLPIPARPDPDSWIARLYDVESDPGEHEDLSSSLPELTHQLDSELSAWFASVESERKRINDESPVH